MTNIHNRLRGCIAMIRLCAFILFGCTLAAQNAAPPPPPPPLPPMPNPIVNDDDSTGDKVDDSAHTLIPALDDEFANDAGTPSRNVGGAAMEQDTISASYDLAASMTRNVNAAEVLSVTLAFDANGMDEVVPMFAELLEFQYILDPAVAGSITMTLEADMTRKETWQLFEHILWLAGAYASENHGFLNIYPFKKMPQEQRLLVRHDPKPNVAVEVIRLYNTTATDMVALIKPFVTEGATAQAIQYLNSIMIIETPPNMNKLREIIAKMDILGETRWPQISIPCEFVDVEVIQDELKVILPTIGFPVTTSEKSDGHSVKIIALPRLQLLLAAAPTEGVLHEVRRWTRLLDTEDAAEDVQIYFYDVKYNKAEDLAEAVGAFFTQTSSSASQSNRSKSTNSTSAKTPSKSTNRNAVTQRINSRRAKATSDEKPQSVYDYPVNIYSDGNHNRLIIKTSPKAYSHLQALLERLDTPPLQVVIKVTIADLTLTSRTEMGFRYAWEGIINELHGRTLAISSGLPAATGTIVRFTNTDDTTLMEFVRSVVGDSNVRVIASPQIIATSDEEAVINVGESVPIITSDQTGTDTTSTTTRNFEYRDTGIILTVTPQITANKLVTLDIKQEVSEALDTTGDEIDTPTIRNRQLSTTLIARDGEVIMFGGLIRNSNEKSDLGIPIFGQIPFLGKLFSSSKDNNTRTELLLIIQVNVIDINTDHGKIIEEYHEAVELIEENRERK